MQGVGRLGTPVCGNKGVRIARYDIFCSGYQRTEICCVADMGRDLGGVK